MGEDENSDLRKDWPQPAQMLSESDVGELPPKPQFWQSSKGPIVLHGDLFGDGRHLAVVGTTVTTLAVVDEGAWKMVGRDPTEPAWLPKGTSPEEWGYYNYPPPPEPFVLKDLDGDKVPELLVAFDNDGYHLGYKIAKKDGAGIKFLEVRSEQGEPERVGEYLAVTSLTSGRKAWWSGTTYYRWQGGNPSPAARWIEDARDPEKGRWIAERVSKEGVARTFEIVAAGDARWSVRECKLGEGVETSDEKDFAKVRFSHGQGESEDSSGYLAEMTLMFEMATGLPGNTLTLPSGNRETFDFSKATAGVRVEIEGGDEAKKVLKRVPLHAR